VASLLTEDAMTVTVDIAAALICYQPSSNAHTAAVENHKGHTITGSNKATLHAKPITCHAVTTRSTASQGLLRHYGIAMADRVS
jgi:hypothetical protein